MSEYILREDKYPTTRQNYLGIEIEFVSKFNRKKIENLLVKEQLEYYCCLGYDASISPSYKTVIRTRLEESGNGSYTLEKYPMQIPDGSGYELRVLCTEKDLSFIMTKVANVLKKAKAYVNKSCGLHVHLDMRQRNAAQCAAALLSKQNEMTTLVPKERLGSKYCKLTKATNIDKALKNGNLSRYKAINLSSYKELKTIEVRLHEGSVDYKEIVNWCRYLIGVVSKKQWKGYKKYATSRVEKISAQAS